MTQPIIAAIEAINNPNCTSTKLFKSMKKVIKALSQYSSQNQQLPPETLIPCCLFVLPQKLTRYLQLEQDSILSSQPQSLSANLLTEQYLNSLYKLLKSSSKEILHVIVQGMSRSVNLLHAYPLISKKWMKLVIDLWSTSYQNLNVCLRCHMIIHKFISNASSEIYSWVLRRLYVGYFENCKQVSWRNLQHINFMINSYWQMLRVDESSAYYEYQFATVEATQKVQLLNKLYSYQILNLFKLFSALLSRGQSQQLSALIYPLIEITCVYARLTESHQYLPLKLHLIEFMMQIMINNCVYIPAIYYQLIKLLNCKVFKQKLTKNSQNITQDINIMYKLSKAQLKNANVINHLFKNIVRKLLTFIKLMAEKISGCQVLRMISKKLKTFKEQYRYTGYQIQIQKIIKLTNKAANKIFKLRSDMKMALNDEKLIKIFQKKRLKNNPKLAICKLEDIMKRDEQQLIKSKLKAQRQDQQENVDDDQLKEDQDQLESGWEEASQGASSFNQEQQDIKQQSQVQQNKQSVSYEGDPQNPDQAEMQWSQHSWQSQNENF